MTPDDALGCAIWMLRQPLIGPPVAQRWAALDERTRYRYRCYGRFVRSLAGGLAR